MSFLPKPTETIEIAKLREGKAVAVYSVYADHGKAPNDFTINKGNRCLVQIFDGGGDFADNILRAFTQLESAAAETPERSPSEKFLLFMLGRRAVCSSDVYGMPELNSEMANFVGSVRRNSAWSLVKLKGWTRPSVLILHRIFAATATTFSRGTRSTYNYSRLSLEDANLLREGLLRQRSLISSLSKKESE